MYMYIYICIYVYMYTYIYIYAYTYDLQLARFWTAGGPDSKPSSPILQDLPRARAQSLEENGRRPLHPPHRRVLHPKP